MSEQKNEILKDIQVLDLTDLRGSFCGKLLADLGADVTKVEMQGINPAQKRLGPAFIYSNMNKSRVAIDPETDDGIKRLGKLIENADILIETCDQTVMHRLGLEHNELRRLNRALIHISISDFGQSGPKRGYKSSATTLSAAGGQMFVCRDITGNPVPLHGTQPYYTASLYGAVAALMHLRKRFLTGEGSHIDLSIQEAVASTLDHVLVDYFSDGSMPERSNVPYVDLNFPILTCSDGYIQITILQNWETLVELLDSESMSEDLQKNRWLQPSFRESSMEHIVDVVKKWTEKHTVQELFQLGQAMAFPWVPVADTRMVLESPQLSDRGFFIRSAAAPNGPEIILPGSPYRFSVHPPQDPNPSSGTGGFTSRTFKKIDLQTDSMPGKQNYTSRQSCRTEDILKGIRVLDLTRVLSGPYCTRILADFGAEVLKIQTGKTALGTEQNGTAYFKTWNRNKRSVCLDLSSEKARNCLLELVSISDIVVENYSPRVMANWGLSYDLLKEVKPSLIMLSLSAMGQTGPWKDYVGFGTTFHALSGLTAASAAATDQPYVHIGHAYGDTVAGLYGALAILAALDFRESTGRGHYIDLSGYEAMCTFTAPALIWTGQGNSGETGYDGPVLDGCFPCRGKDRWCAITIDGVEEWEKLFEILKYPGLQAGDSFKKGMRQKNIANLNTRICKWTSGLPAEDVEEILQEAGIPAHVVQNAVDISKDRHLAARNFFRVPAHPTQGIIISDRSAAWPWNSEPEDWCAAPELGEANYEIFVKRLGMREEVFKDFVKQGIIG